LGTGLLGVIGLVRLCVEKGCAGSAWSIWQTLADFGRLWSKMRIADCRLENPDKSQNHHADSATTG
jgi:hypothetical protein